MAKAIATVKSVKGVRASKVDKGASAIKSVTSTDHKTTEIKGSAKSDVIKSVKGATGGDYTAIVAPGHDTLLVKSVHWTAALGKVAVVGGSFKEAVKLHKEIVANPPQASLARGITGRDAPQSSKAVADRRGTGNPTVKASAKPAPKAAAKKAERKAAKAEKAAPKGDDTRAITIVKKDFAFGREGTARRSCWDKALKAKTVAAYIAAGGAAKYLPRWVSAGAIKLG